MKYATILIACAVLLAMTQIAAAQAYRTDSIAIVAEESVLQPNKKELVLVVTQNISEAASITYQITSNEGRIHEFPVIQFPNGLRKKQAIPLWNGEFNMFQKTAWLSFSVIITTTSWRYYIKTDVAVGFSEQYKEPMIISLSETKDNSGVYTITAKGNFDTYEPSTVVINKDVIIPPKSIWYERPGILHFTLGATDVPSGKYLLTVCQTGRCDSMTGRHQ